MKRLEFGSRTYIMGILNVTPDSFSGDGLLGEGDVLTRSAGASPTVCCCRR